MPNPLRRLSIRDQIVAAMTLVIVVLATLVGTTVMLNSRQEATQRTQEANRELVHQLDSSMANMQSELMDITSLPYVSQTTISSIINPAGQSHTETQERILEALYTIMLSKSYISFIAAISPDSPGYYVATDSSFGLRPYGSLLESEILAEFIRSGSDFDCFLMRQPDTSILTSNRTDKLLFLRTLKDVRHGFETIGYLLVGVPLSRVTDGYLGLESEHLAIGLIDGRGHQLAHSGAEVALPLADGSTFDFSAPQAGPAPGPVAGGGRTGDTSFRLSGTTYLMVYARENTLGWTSYYITDEASLSPGLENVAATIALVAAASVAVFFVIAYIFTNTIVSPLDRLRGSMRRFEAGDFHQRVEVARDDEIGQVLRGYNRMVEQIRSLIDQNYAVQLREKEAELTVLQSQMNPHLIYNTLDLIYWRAQAAGESDFARDIYALSQLLRLSVNRGHRWIGLREEGEFLEHYLWLQNELMGSRLRYQVRFDQAVLPFQVPRFILQPLVENAVVHGLDRRDEGGTLSVTAELADDRLLIRVADDGEGLDPATAEAVFHGPGTGHAVSNIRERLDIYFPGDWSWRVDSGEGEGCRIELSLPAVTEPERSAQPLPVGGR